MVSLQTEPCSPPVHCLRIGCHRWIRSSSSMNRYHQPCRESRNNRWQALVRRHYFQPMTSSTQQGHSTLAQLFLFILVTSIVVKHTHSTPTTQASRDKTVDVRMLIARPSFRVTNHSACFTCPDPVSTQAFNYVYARPGWGTLETACFIGWLYMLNDIMYYI